MQRATSHNAVQQYTAVRLQRDAAQKRKQCPEPESVIDQDSKAISILKHGKGCDDKVQPVSQGQNIASLGSMLLSRL